MEPGTELFVLGRQNLGMGKHIPVLHDAPIDLKTYTGNNNCTLLLPWYVKVQLLVLQMIKDQYET